MCGLDLSCWRNFFNFDFTQQFLSNLLASFFGVALGVLGALWLSQHQEKATEKERSEKILKLLYAELKFNLDRLRFLFKDKNILDNYGYLTAFLKDELWKTFSDGGEIQWVKDLSLLDLISNAYFRIKAIKALFEWIIRVGPSNVANLTEKSNTTWAELLLPNLEDTIDHIQEALKLIEKHVDITEKAELTPTFIHG